MIRNVTDADLERVRVFLEAHVDTSLFLLSNLAVLGPRLGDHQHSGNYRLVEERGRIVAVFCLTRSGNLLVQAGGRADLAEQILEACEGQPFEVRGVIGEWPAAQAIWRELRTDPRFEPLHSAKDVLYRLALSPGALAQATAAQPTAAQPGVIAGTLSPIPGITARPLTPEDFEAWNRLNIAYLAERHLPMEGSGEERRKEFISRARARLWWGVFAQDQLVSIAGLNATYGALGQVGGVYTRPESRSKGLSRAVMRLLVEDCRNVHQFERLILFTGEDNTSARRVYEAVGFELAGAFGLLLGARRSTVRAHVRHGWTGQSGEIYTYDVYDWPARLSPGPGNFIFVTSTSEGGWRPVLIGESADLSTIGTTIAVHERRFQGSRSGGRPPATHVHVRLNFNPSAVRRREANDLSARWRPDQSET